MVVDWAILTVFVVLPGGYFFEPVADQTLSLTRAIEQTLLSIEIQTQF